VSSAGAEAAITTLKSKVSSLLAAGCCDLVGGGNIMDDTAIEAEVTRETPTRQGKRHDHWKRTSIPAGQTCGNQNSHQNTEGSERTLCVKYRNQPIPSFNLNLQFIH
jgi:hypothetical protein